MPAAAPMRRRLEKGWLGWIGLAGLVGLVGWCFARSASPLALPKQRRQQEIVPDALAQQCIRMIDAVNADAVVELEVALASPLTYGDVVEGALIFVDDRAGAPVIPGRAHALRLRKKGQG